MSIKNITEAGDLRDKKVLVRVDWNVPLDAGVVKDDFRIRKSLSTLEYLKKAGAKIIIISHTSLDTDSLRPVAEYVNKFFPLAFESEGEVVLLENLRHNVGEKDNDLNFAKKLASRADLFVNEAFSESHRQYASIVGIPQFLPSFIGLQFALEVKELSKAFYPKRPFLFILGGAKFDTKLPLLKKFIGIADYVFVGGALAHNFFKEKNMEIGRSLISSGDFKLEGKMLNDNVHLPTDVLVQRRGRVHIDTPNNLEQEDNIVDAGPNSILGLKEMIAKSSSILWNGPLGKSELDFKQSTLELARALAESGKETIIGGGDTLAAIKELDLYDKFSFVSTGGGAMLDFLATGTLPGIEALSR